MINRQLKLSFLFFIIFFVGNSIGQGNEKKASLHDLDLKFVSDQNQTLKFDYWKGRPFVVAMLYTSCEHTCPRIIQSLQKLQKMYDEKKKSIDFVIVTFDPKVDTAEKLSKYRIQTHLNQKNWTFLSGSESHTRRLAMTLGIRYNKNPKTGDISHDNKLVVFNEKGEIAKELVGLNANLEEVFQ